MAKTREVVPRAVRDVVLREFNHRCAVCGADRPHLHHIDENPANNDPQNIIPLCPNCHLVDQHDASNAIPKSKLRFFRRYKHRLILKPQFDSISRRMAFLDQIEESADTHDLEQCVDELIGLVSLMSMGGFFAKQLMTLLKPTRSPSILVIGDPESEARYDAHRREEHRKYRQQLRDAVPSVERLLVELLDHQAWGRVQDTDQFGAKGKQE